MSIYQQLNLARKEFHSLKLKKTGYNKFAGYYYFELGDFLIPALDVLAKYELCAIVSFTKDIATLKLVSTANDKNESFEITSPMGSAALKGCHEVQNVGAVETYQRRYLWVALLEIVEHDALDSITGSKQGEPAERKGQPTSGAWEVLDGDKQSELIEVANIATEYFDSGDVVGLVDYLESKGYDSDTKIALWTQLGSKVRTAIKKEHEARKVAV